MSQDLSALDTLLGAHKASVLVVSCEGGVSFQAVGVSKGLLVAGA